MKKIIAGLLVSFMFTTSAFAWGDREQGMLAGAAGLWVFQQLNKAGQPQGDRVVIQQQAPVIVHSHPPAVIQQRQQYCESVQVQDQFGQHRMVTYCYVK
jgi:hypothetical protein